LNCLALEKRRKRRRRERRGDDSFDPSFELLLAFTLMEKASKKLLMCLAPQGVEVRVLDRTKFPERGGERKKEDKRLVRAFWPCCAWKKQPAALNRCCVWMQGKRGREGGNAGLVADPAGVGGDAGVDGQGPPKGGGKEEGPIIHSFEDVSCHARLIHCAKNHVNAARRKERGGRKNVSTASASNSVGLPAPPKGRGSAAFAALVAPR